MVAKPFIVLCCILAAVLADGKYTDKYDNINWQEIADNKRLLHAYIDCILERGKCTPEGKSFKDNLQEGLETGCAKCTKVQEDGVTIVMQKLITDERALWKELTDKFDPEGTLRKKYEDKVREKGIVIPED